MGLMVHLCHPKTICTLVSFYFPGAEGTPLVEGSRPCVSEVIKLEMPFNTKRPVQKAMPRPEDIVCCCHLLVTVLQERLGLAEEVTWKSGAAWSLKVLQWSPSCLVSFSCGCHPLGFAGCSFVLHFYILFSAV